MGNNLKMEICGLKDFCTGRQQGLAELCLDDRLSRVLVGEQGRALFLLRY